MRQLLCALYVLLCVSVPVVAQERAPHAPTGLVPALGAVMFIPTGGFFQTITNPSGVDFTASTDHNVTENGVQLVTRYDLELMSSGKVVATKDIGKPIPAAGNLISYLQLRTVYSTLTAGSYTLVVAAVGPGGTGRSTASVPFSVAARAPGAPGTPVPKTD